MGPLTIEGLVLVFANLRFPVDLSGGVPAFRHRRGELERITLSAELQQLKTWATPRLRQAVGQLERTIDLWLTAGGIGFGWVTESSAVTGDLYWAPFGDTARLVLGNVRGSNISEPVLAVVLRSIDVVLSSYFERRGRVWVSSQVGRRIARLILPAAGARVPAATGVNFGVLAHEGDRVRTRLDVQLSELNLAPFVVRALELADLATLADEALVRGNLELARQEYLRALESAPRHRDLVTAVAELDLLARHREHEALGLMSDALPVISAGPVGAELLELTGDRSGAIEALDACIRTELYAPLRALLLIRKANLEVDRVSRTVALDSAVATAPSLASVRWARLEHRAATGDAVGALDDAASLESAAHGTLAKFHVWTRSGSALQRFGWAKQAAKCFERGLRYCPEHAEAAMALAKSFIELQQPMRAVSLLERAIQKDDAESATTAQCLVILARILAKEASDIPGAIARVRQVPHGTAVSVEARCLEARWRQTLGDTVGASMAWARMRESIESGCVSDAAVSWLREAAGFERDVRKDLACAERHLALALRLCPHDESLSATYRELVAALTVEDPNRRA
jgi:tetratricopeptide (TPR) repeat protein